MGNIAAHSTVTSGAALRFKDVIAGLAADGVIAECDAKSMLQHDRAQPSTGLHPCVMIANRSVKNRQTPHKPLTVEHLMRWLARKSGLPYQPVDPLRIDIAAVTRALPYGYAAARRILPVSVNAHEMVIATSDPYDVSWVEELERMLRKSVVRVLASPTDISRYLGEFYSLSRALQQAEASGDGAAARPGPAANLEQLVELGRRGRLDANDHHIVSIVDWLLQYAFESRASDIHLEPRREKSEIRFRIDGVLHLAYQPPTPVLGAVISRIKTLGRMDVAEKRRPLDGRLKTRTPEGAEVELRLSTIPTALGEKMVVRIFDPTVLVKSCSELGLGEEDIKRWNAMMAQPHGIILVTGPTGSGKTTTLYTTLKRLATPGVNVCTIEDPIEMVEPSFNQMQVQPQIGLGFSGGVRALLRQDPDIIMIGEIRDLETAEIAVQAALTGHLVLSTLHTNDAASAITRLLELGVPAYLINATVLGVLAQRLVRTLCPHCKRPTATDGEEWRALVRPYRVAPPGAVSVAQGCLECRHTGYRGRVGIYETMILTPSMREHIKPNADSRVLRDLVIKEGMQPLHLSGARKVYTGLTTIEEVQRVAPPLIS
jgi:general secretion pathway protein E